MPNFDNLGDFNPYDYPVDRLGSINFDYQHSEFTPPYHIVELPTQAANTSTPPQRSSESATAWHMLEPHDQRLVTEIARMMIDICDDGLNNLSYLLHGNYPYQLGDRPTLYERIASRHQSLLVKLDPSGIGALVYTKRTLPTNLDINR